MKSMPVPAWSVLFYRQRRDRHLVSQFLAGRSDKKGDRKNLIVFCCVLGMLACVLFAWNRNYFILLFIGVFLSSFGSTANPQMFALAREHADRTGRKPSCSAQYYVRRFRWPG
jgi:MFS family permease